MRDFDYYYHNSLLLCCRGAYEEKFRDIAYFGGIMEIAVEVNAHTLEK